MAAKRTFTSPSPWALSHGGAAAALRRAAVLPQVGPRCRRADPLVAARCVSHDALLADPATHSNSFMTSALRCERVCSVGTRQAKSLEQPTTVPDGTPPTFFVQDGTRVWNSLRRSPTAPHRVTRCYARGASSVTANGAWEAETPPGVLAWAAAGVQRDSTGRSSTSTSRQP